MFTRGLQAAGRGAADTSVTLPYLPSAPFAFHLLIHQEDG